MVSDVKDWKSKALTDIWTRDAQREPGRPIPSGLPGSTHAQTLLSQWEDGQCQTDLMNS
jgi:hypothetical protein